MTPATPIVFIVDDDVAVCRSLESLIRFAGWQPEVSTTAGEFLTRGYADVPSCLVLDVRLPDVNGLDLQERIVDEGMDLPIVFITGHADIPMTVRAMRAGAVEFLTKPFEDEALLNAIGVAIERSRAAHGRNAERQAVRESYASLTRREREVMSLVASGLSNKAIGRTLGISVITVKAHRGKVMNKMKAGSLADLVKMAVKLDAPRQAGQSAP